MRKQVVAVQNLQQFFDMLLMGDTASIDTASGQSPRHEQ